MHAILLREYELEAIFGMRIAAYILGMQRSYVPTRGFLL